MTQMTLIALAQWLDDHALRIRIQAQRTPSKTTYLVAFRNAQQRTVATGRGTDLDQAVLQARAAYYVEAPR